MARMCRVLLVDDNLEYLVQVGACLRRMYAERPELFLGMEVTVEACNSAFFVARKLDECRGDKFPWDLIISDVYMPAPRTSPNIEPTSNAGEKVLEDGTKAYLHGLEHICMDQYPWHHGAFHIAKKILELRKKGVITTNRPRLVAISNKLSGSPRDHLYDLRNERSWFLYLDKAQEPTCRRTTMWNPLDANVFEIALSRSVAEIHKDYWGDSVFQRIDGINQAGLVANSPRFRAVVVAAKEFARNKALFSALLVGEMGVGKELIARMMHNIRIVENRGKGYNAASFEAVNCASLSDDLFVPMLFGYTRGLYPEAPADPGAAGRADHGTLFLDRIECLTRSQQAATSTLIASREFRPLNITRNAKFQGSMIVATAENDAHMDTAAPALQSDLASQFECVIRLSPLRERKEDIVPMANFVLASKFPDSNFVLSEQAKQWLRDQPWYGNVRELHSVLSQAALLSRSKTLELGCILRASG